MERERKENGKRVGSVEKRVGREWKESWKTNHHFCLFQHIVTSISRTGNKVDLSPNCDKFEKERKIWQIDLFEVLLIIRELS